MTKLLSGKAERKYVGVPEFAAAAAVILHELKLVQERGTVTDVPDERTVRYYLSEGLIQPPEEKQGTASVFSYIHLLQLLAVKKLQAEHLTIRKIRELVAGKTERELERLIGVGTGVGKARESTEAMRYLETLLTSQSSPASSTTEMLSLADIRFASEEPKKNRSWIRVEIEPGLELHIRSNYQPPINRKKRRSLMDRIARAISNRIETWNKEK